MAHETLTRADLAAWGANPTVTAAEFWHLDQKGYRGINGDDGGTYAPTVVPITIGGLGFDVTGPMNAGDVRDIVISASGSFACNADAAFNALLDVTASGSLHVAAGAAYSIEADGDFLGEIDFANKLRINSGAHLTVESGATFNLDGGSTAVISTALTLNNSLIRNNSNGRALITNRSLKSTNTNQTAGVEYDYIEMNVTGAGAITLTLKIATALTPTEGEKIFVRKIGAGAGGLVIANEGSAANLALVAGANTANFVFMFEATANKWRLFSAIGTYTLGADAV